MFSWRCFPFVESAPRAYRLKASNAAPLSSTSAGTFPSKSANPLNVFNVHSEKSVEFSLKGLNRLFDDSERAALAPVTHRHDADDCDSHGEQHHRQQPSNTGDCPRQPYFFVP